MCLIALYIELVWRLSEFAFFVRLLRWSHFLFFLGEGENILQSQLTVKIKFKEVRRMENKEYNHSEVNNIDVAKMQQENSEAYLNALRQLEQEKEATKKAKRKSRFKKICIVIIALIIARILLSTMNSFIDASIPVLDINNECVYNMEVEQETLQKYISTYLEGDFHSEKKEIKKLYKLGKKAYKLGNFRVAGYIFEICTDYSNDYEDKILDDFSYENMDQFYVGIARAIIESGDYETAMTYYRLCEDQESIAEEVKETRYNLGIVTSKRENITMQDISLKRLKDINTAILFLYGQERRVQKNILILQKL